MSGKYGCHKSLSEEYEIFICNSENTEKYYISFKDVNGLFNEIEISEQVYFEFLKSFRDMNNHQWNSWYHSTITGLHDNMILSMSIPSVDDIVIRRELVETTKKVVASLPTKQRRRFILYYEYGFTYGEIAAAEKCSIVSVERTVLKAKRSVISKTRKENC